MSWRDFWNREKNTIYVNERHGALHDDLVAKGIASLVRSPDSIVLDYGCGDASAADLVARKCAKLYLYDAAPNVRARLARRFEGRDTIALLGEEALDGLADGALDLIVVNSVLQYIPKRDFETLLDGFRAKLKPTGRLVLADVISPATGPLDDIRALLSFAFEGGFLIAACVGLVRTFFSDYRALRAQYGLTRYHEKEMLALLAAHGLKGARAPLNIGHNQARMLFEATPDPAAS